MAAPTINTVRSRMATALAAVTGWKESTFHFDRFGLDTGSLMAKVFVIGTPGTVITDPKARVWTRPSTEPGMRVRTQIRAKWAHPLRPDGIVADLGDALADEQTLMQAAAKFDPTDIGVPKPTNIRRTISADGAWQVTEVSWELDHLYNLANPDVVYTPPVGADGGVNVFLGDGVFNNNGTADVDFATNSGAHITGGKVAAKLANGSVQVNGSGAVEAVFLNGCTDTGAGIGPDLANASVEVNGSGEIVAVVLDGATDTSSGVGPSLANGSVEVSGGAVQAIVLDGATDTGAGIGPDLRTGDPLEVVGGEVQVDQTAVLGDGGVEWNDTTRKVDATAAAFALRQVSASDVLGIVKQNLGTAPTVTDQPGRLRITWTQSGRTDGDGETAVILIQPRDKSGNAVDDLHLRQMSVQLRARWSLVGAGAVVGTSGDPICRVGVVAINRSADWLATAIDHSVSVGVVGSSLSSGLARTASSGTAAGDGTNTQPGMNGIDATFAPFDPVYGTAGFGTLTYTTSDGSTSIEANSQEASGDVSDTTYRWAVAILVGNSQAVSGGTNTIDVDLEAVAFQSHAS
jgi:hypothetical protein